MVRILLDRYFGSNLMLLFIISVVTVFAAGCSRDKGDLSRFAIVIEKPKSKVGSLAVWPPVDKKVCYGVNVTASDLPGHNPGCGPIEGVRSAFAEAGTEIEVLVRVGSARKIEAYAWVTSDLNAPCPQWSFSCDSLKYCNIYKVAEKTGVDISGGTTTVTLTTSFPGWESSAASVAGHGAICNGKLRGVLRSGGSINEGTVGAADSIYSHPTNESLFGKDIYSYGVVTSYSLLRDSVSFQIPSYIRSVTKKPDTGKYYGLIGMGQVVEVDPGSGTWSDLSILCPFESCTVPFWMQSISAGMGTHLFGLDHSGAIYRIDGLSSVVVMPTTVLPTISQVTYF